MKVAAQPRAKTLTLPAVLDMRNAQGLKDTLMAALESNPVLRTPGVQVLLAASQLAQSDGGRLILANPSSALEAAFRDLGLSQKLKDWGAADA